VRCKLDQRFRRETKNKRNQPQLDLTTKTTKCFKMNWKSSSDNWCGWFLRQIWIRRPKRTRSTMWFGYLEIDGLRFARQNELLSDQVQLNNTSKPLTIMKTWLRMLCMKKKAEKYPTKSSN
jgi:hypothetical protein